jgi:ABC-type nickel/cobalt efflux system permease component RcnA
MIQSIFVFLIISLTQAFACAICSVDIPIVKSDINITANQNNTNFSIKWHFEEEFVNSLKQYDTNKNGTYESSEQKEIEESLFVYIKRLHYLTHIKYDKVEDFDTAILVKKIEPYKTKMSFENGGMTYDYSFQLDFVLQKSYRLDIGFYDAGQNFLFLLGDVVVNGYDGKEMIKLYAAKSRIFFDVTDEQLVMAKQKVVQKTDKISFEDNISDDVYIEEVNTVEEKKEQNSFIDTLSFYINKLKLDIKDLLNDIKENNSFISYFWLLLFSFLYGVLHAIGPGHGKSLVSTYFLNENRSVSKAAAISLLIGVVHTFSAFMITVVIFFILKTIFVGFVNDIEYVASKISAVLIIFIALYLLYKKYRISTQKLKFTVHNPNASSCGCSSCNTKSEDIMVIIAAGIVPCPGTITVFIFTMGLGIYFVGFLSAIFMSLGMSLIIFIMAYLSIGIRKKSQSNGAIVKYLEYGSLVFILCLGFLLLL